MALFQKPTQDSSKQPPSGMNFESQKGPTIPRKGIDPSMNKVNDEISVISRQLRMLEERYTTLRKKIQVSDQNIIEDTNKIFTQLKLIVSDINDIKMKLEDMRQKLEMFQKEIGDMADKQDLKVLQKYVEMWEPMQFLTEKEAMILIRQALEEKKK